MTEPPPCRYLTQRHLKQWCQLQYNGQVDVKYSGHVKSKSEKVPQVPEQEWRRCRRRPGGVVVQWGLDDGNSHEQEEEQVVGDPEEGKEEGQVPEKAQ